MDHVHQTKQDTLSLLKWREGAFFNKTSLLLIHPLLLSVPFFYFCIPIFSFFSLVFSFPVPISLPGPAQGEYSPFCTYKHKTLSKTRWRVSLTEQVGWHTAAGWQLAGITHCRGSANSRCRSWTQQQPNSLKTNSSESSAMQRQGWQSTVLHGTRWLWQELEGIFFFFPSSFSKYTTLSRCRKFCQNPKFEWSVAARLMPKTCSCNLYNTLNRTGSNVKIKIIFSNRKKKVEKGRGEIKPYRSRFSGFSLNKFLIQIFSWQRRLCWLLFTDSSFRWHFVGTFSSLRRYYAKLPSQNKRVIRRKGAYCGSAKARLGCSRLDLFPALLLSSHANLTHSYGCLYHPSECSVMPEI